MPLIQDGNVAAEPAHLLDMRYSNLIASNPTGTPLPELDRDMILKALRTDEHRRQSEPRRVVTVLAVLAALLCVSACTTSGSLPSMSVAQANASLTKGYRIGGGDSLKVNVFDEPTLTGEYEVGLDGVLSFPLIGMINATGMTSDVLSEAISAKLSEGGYVLSPRVTVEVSSRKPFFMLGEVNTPGEYAYVGSLTLEQAVAKAGGFTARANKRAIILMRQEWNSPRRIKLEDSPLLIAPGDTVTVQEAFF